MRKLNAQNAFQRKVSKSSVLFNFQSVVAKSFKSSFLGLAVSIWYFKDWKCPICVTSCLVAPSPFMRIKIMKKFFNRWKTNFLQEMKSSGGEGIKKRFRRWLSRTNYEIHDGHIRKMLYLRDIFNQMCIWKTHLPKFKKVETWIFK